jgi:hypothetical protein
MEAKDAEDEHDDHDQSNQIDEFMHGLNLARQFPEELTKALVSSAAVRSQRTTIMKSVILWLLGVPIVVIILLNVTGMLGH